MQTQSISNGLLQLGFNSGWVVSGDEIVLWEHSVPTPSFEEILEAAKNYVEPELTVEQKLGLVGLKVDDLKAALGLNG